MWDTNIITDVRESQALNGGASNGRTLIAVTQYPRTRLLQCAFGIVMAAFLAGQQQCRLAKLDATADACMQSH